MGEPLEMCICGYPLDVDNDECKIVGAHPPPLPDFRPAEPDRGTPYWVDYGCTLAELQAVLDRAKADGIDFDQYEVMAYDGDAELLFYRRSTPLEREQAEKAAALQNQRARDAYVHPATDPTLTDLPEIPIYDHRRSQR
jgi:hypothetical protein